jgi:hypothetical protein
MFCVCVCVCVRVWCACHPPVCLSFTPSCVLVCVWGGVYRNPPCIYVITFTHTCTNTKPKNHTHTHTHTTLSLSHHSQKPAGFNLDSLRIGDHFFYRSKYDRKSRRFTPMAAPCPADEMGGGGALLVALLALLLVQKYTY